MTHLIAHSFRIVPWSSSCLLVKLLVWWAWGPKFAHGSFYYDFRDLVLSASKFGYDLWRQSEIKLDSYSTEFNGTDAAGIFSLILTTPKLKLRSSLKYCWCCDSRAVILSRQTIIDGITLKCNVWKKILASPYHWYKLNAHVFNMGYTILWHLT